ncbi:MAG: hypothetical protein JSR82_21390 [Verrucomicrobia bacterium]|nr:hypothetical protein [Verrucomicrobiota bacterium]
MHAYRLERLPQEEYERDYFRRSGSLPEAVRRAALAIDQRGKRHSHQRRLKLEVLKRARKALPVARLRRAGSFAEIHRIVEDSIRPIRGIGKLAVYDIAHRIGTYLNLAPEEVFIHAGVRQGLRAVVPGWKKPTIRPADLPAPLSDLPAEDVENLLCIYHDQLARIAGVKGA